MTHDVKGALDVIDYIVFYSEHLKLHQFGFYERLDLKRIQVVEGVKFPESEGIVIRNGQLQVLKFKYFIFELPDG